MINKIIYGGQTLIDLTEDTVTEDTLLEGYKAHDKRGVIITGTYTPPGTVAQYAVIGVTYPSGSTCICTNGIVTYTANDTSGQCIFYIPSDGNWTVSCTNGSKTADKIVSITSSGQTVLVTLVYELVLLENGVDNTSVTGGWAANANTTAQTIWDSTTLDGYSHYRRSGGSSGGYTWLHPINSFSLTDYSALKLTIHGHSGRLDFRLEPKAGSSTNLSIMYVNFNAVTNDITISLDISGITSTCWPGILTNAGVNATTHYYVKKLWFES